MESVTASDLVRHFGTWRDRALSQPVYVHHHGRAKLVLASVDFMEHLVAKRGSDASDHSIGALLDAIDTIAIVADERLRIVGASGPARRHLLRRDGDGDDRLDRMFVDGIGPVLLRAIRPVLGGGPTERLQLRVGPRADRQIEVTIQPFGAGVCIIGHDRTAAEAARSAAMGAAAIEQALAHVGDIATLRINLRGYIVDASPTFEAMTSLPPGGYRSVRLPTLFDLPTRVGVGEALERTIEMLAPAATKARLVAGDGGAIPVCIAFSGELLRTSDGVVIAALKVDPTGGRQA